MGIVQPKMPVEAYQTYRIAAPASTHFRQATCAETDCPAYLNGWRVRVEGLDAALLHTARNSGRRYVEQQVREGETWLVFEAGQSCFQASQHRTRLDRPELFLVQGGDWRGNPTGYQRRHDSAADWVEDFGEHQQRIADQVERG